MTRFEINQFAGIVIDDFTFNRTPVPEPTSIIGILGLGAFGVTTLRKRKQATAIKV